MSYLHIMFKLHISSESAAKTDLFQSVVGACYETQKLNRAWSCYEMFDPSKHGIARLYNEGVIFKAN